MSKTKPKKKARKAKARTRSLEKRVSKPTTTFLRVDLSFYVDIGRLVMDRVPYEAVMLSMVMDGALERGLRSALPRRDRSRIRIVAPCDSHIVVVR